MIIDSETNFLYLSEVLQSREQFFRKLTLLLNRNSINFKLLPETNDIWAVDYMPIQIDLSNFIQFRYEPDYLQDDEFILTQTNSHSVCKAIDLITNECEIKLDGGNMIKGKNWVILTDKIFKENADLKKNELINKLENLLQVKVIIIPKEPNDFTGHADGVLRYYDNETVLINSYKPTDKREFQKRLTKELRNHGLRAIEIPYSTYDNPDYDMADGLYINYLQMDNFILLPTFEKKEDETACRQFEQLFSGQTIETIDSREISVDGGVLNCITWNIKIGENGR
ncbi:MAG: agmatine deiminase family protein [Cytophagales bacterium]|nr:agmatine deiminase family protein [Cytophagales bacterium]MCA6376460.1 agmatine deiminase family protein [Cytophagales bacterium]MCA6385230.1 agmatine deiminase family protein [Cytophagales bacterium]